MDDENPCFSAGKLHDHTCDLGKDVADVWKGLGDQVTSEQLKQWARSDEKFTPPSSALLKRQLLYNLMIIGYSPG